MFPCLEKVYQMVLQTQLQFLDNDEILQIKLQDSYRLILKKDFLHIYNKEEPFISLLICFPNLVQWYVVKDLLIGFSINGYEFTSHQGNLLKKLKSLLAGRMLFSKVQDFFYPQKILGSGSSSKVMGVTEKESGQEYAAKCVKKEDMSFQEIEINNQLQHPTFVKVKEVYQGETSFYIVMDLLKGKTLQLYLGYHKPFQLEQTKQIMHALLEGIEFMHSKNIMHRDIKPENIILEVKGGQVRLKIVDLGLATYSTLIEKFKNPKCGTIGFVAPEIINLQNPNGTYDKACDIFSCGVIFYRLLTGRDVFPGSQFSYVFELNKKCNIDFTYLTLQQLPYAFVLLRNLVQRMLSRDPKLRPTAIQCLNHEFFKNIQKYSVIQKKQGFLQSKQHTVEFSKDQEIQEYQGSFVTTERMQYSSQPRQKQKSIKKLNTSQFDHII
ncbi:unnamed protein product (macronuclear) [Paramecium tetraurelia]|uniref:Protein kinase domain-containing protein n=1 Tax=Paramecium tetraurelia TaxID=5888 RepID=A0BN05_PARTE|nr:uncharacterized protein GSPATT00030559001 [Paramecium tetraurelia]CAK59922.1 unnamed protein product [Paramecium tetraurelia]|eukprot:XP_001427320.1 hypothetical protein (macronuclear) [Paramecium tetraurelia strain d4-2]